MFLQIALFIQAAAPQPLNDPRSWIQSGDYPTSELINASKGRTVAEFSIKNDGGIAGCTIVETSGSAILDTTVCSLVSSRAKFSPAKDAAGMPVAGIYRRGVRWTLKDEGKLFIPWAPQTVSVSVKIGLDGRIERCEITESAARLANLVPDYCSRFRVGELVEPGYDQAGKNSRYELMLSTTVEVRAQ